MTTTFENSKGYKVLALSADEIKVWPRAKVCDRCARKIGSRGFYVGAYNLLYCPDCYEEWHNSTPEKQKLQDLRENTYLAKAIVHIAEVLSKNKSRIKVHCSTHKRGPQTYYFTKDAKHCLCIKYDPTLDFGNGSPSGSRLSEVEIHTNNAFKLQDIHEIQLSDVPECILELLSYLK
ncbi:hypothetical protein [uncultured Alistipes sp.]|uniref:hypothetical protein n=1 Tax=uncultured Alistipes sp. TaxID=538949 RepID=UPI00258669ED|nr:hypothetical protein [uncultured Alistipes sp.]